MTRYVAFLRGVMPMNAKMPELKRAFEGAGFTDVKTVLGSGNVIFTARTAPTKTLERKAEAAMMKHLGRTFMTFVRSVDSLRSLLASDPYAAFRLEPDSKRVVSFLREKPKSTLSLPIEREGARILVIQGHEVFSAYVRGPRTPVFMVIIEEAFGKDVTTRTWETVGKVST